MKNLMKLMPFILAVAMLGLTACGSAETADPTVLDYVTAGTTLELEQPPYAEDVIALADYEPAELLAAFGAFSGEVMYIEPIVIDDEAVPGEYYISVISEDEGQATFFIDSFTFVLGEAVNVGDIITGFYPMELPLALVYPPRYSVSVIVNGDFPAVFVDRFDEDFVSADSMLSLAIGDYTEISHQNGEPFEGELAGQLLVVVYDEYIGYFPAAITPGRIIVLYDRLDDDLYEVDDIMDYAWAYEIIVNGVGLADVYHITIGGDNYPTHVPLVPIAEVFGASVDWDYYTGTVSLEGLNGSILFTVDLPDFMVDGEAVTLTRYAVVIDDAVYVPIAFFTDVFGVDNAYLEDGHIFIYNDEVI